MATPDFGKLTSMHFYAWRKGLKTGCYYLRTRAAVEAIQFTVDQEAAKKANTANGGAATEAAEPVACPLRRPVTRHFHYIEA